MRQNFQKKTAVFLDLSYLWRSAQRLEAWISGLVGSENEACEINIADLGVRIQFKELNRYIEGEFPNLVETPLIVSKESELCGEVLDQACQAGFAVESVKQSAFERERGVDQLLSFLLGKTVQKYSNHDLRIVLFSGDRDFAPIVERLCNEGFEVQVRSFEGHDGRFVSKHLREAASTFVSLDQIYQAIVFRKTPKGRARRYVGYGRRNVQ